MNIFHKKSLMLGSMASISFLLAACGGGSGTTAADATDNPAPVANPAPHDPEPGVTGPEPAPTISAREMAATGVASLTLHNALVMTAMTELPGLEPAARTAARSAGSNSCLGGGASTLTFEDNDDSNSVSAGDTYTSGFADCNDGYGLSYVSGSVRGRILDVAGNLPDFLGGDNLLASTWGFQQEITFDELVIRDTESGKDSQINGVATIAAQHETSNNLYQFSINNGGMRFVGEISQQTASISYQQGASLAYALNTATRRYGFTHGFASTVTLDGTDFNAVYTNSAAFYGSVLAANIGVGVPLPVDTPPTEGVWQVQWGEQAPVRLSALASGADLLLATDTDRDGEFETSESLLWADMAP